MSDRVPRHRPMTLEEYLAFEDASSERHEFVAGEVYLMSGATRRHGRIAGNIFARLWAVARGGPCEVQANEVKLRAGEQVIYYPDVMVACAPDDDDERIVRAPCFVVEVTSPSTRSIDRREKLANYRSIPTLRAYLIVDQRRRFVERHWRDEHGDWWREDLAGDGNVPIPCPETTLTLDDIYEGVQLTTVAEPDETEYESA